MATVASKLTTPTLPLGADDLEPDEAWKQNMRDMIEKGMEPMVRDAKKNMEDKLREAPVDPEQREILTKEYHLVMRDLRNLATEQYETALQRERAERRWTAGKDVDEKWHEVLIKEQQAIMDNLQKGDGSGQQRTHHSSSSDDSQREPYSDPRLRRPAPSRASPSTRDPLVSNVSRSSAPTESQRSASGMINQASPIAGRWAPPLESPLAEESRAHHYHHHAHQQQQPRTLDNSRKTSMASIGRAHGDGLLRNGSITRNSGTSNGPQIDGRRVWVQPERPLSDEPEEIAKPSSGSPTKTFTSKPPSIWVPPMSPEQDAAHSRPYVHPRRGSNASTVSAMSATHRPSATAQNVAETASNVQRERTTSSTMAAAMTPPTTPGGKDDVPRLRSGRDQPPYARSESRHNASPIADSQYARATHDSAAASPATPSPVYSSFRTPSSAIGDPDGHMYGSPPRPPAATQLLTRPPPRQGSIGVLGSTASASPSSSLPSSPPRSSGEHFPRYAAVESVPTPRQRTVSRENGLYSGNGGSGGSGSVNSHNHNHNNSGGSGTHHNHGNSYHARAAYDGGAPPRSRCASGEDMDGVSPLRTAAATAVSSPPSKFEGSVAPAVRKRGQLPSVRVHVSSSYADLRHPRPSHSREDVFKSAEEGGRWGRNGKVAVTEEKEEEWVGEEEEEEGEEEEEEENEREEYGQEMDKASLSTTSDTDLEDMDLVREAEQARLEAQRMAEEAKKKEEEVQRRREEARRIKVEARHREAEARLKEAEARQKEAAARQMEAEVRHREEEERRRKEQEMRKKEEEAERKADELRRVADETRKKEEELKRIEEDLKRREEELNRREAESLAREEMEKARREEEEKTRREEAERQLRLEAERQKKDQLETQRIAEEARKKEEEKAQAMKKEAELKRQEEEGRKREVEAKRLEEERQQGVETRRRAEADAQWTKIDATRDHQEEGRKREAETGTRAEDAQRPHAYGPYNTSIPRGVGVSASSAASAGASTGTSSATYRSVPTSSSPDSASSASHRSPASSNSSNAPPGWSTWSRTSTSQASSPSRPTTTSSASAKTHTPRSPGMPHSSTSNLNPNVRVDEAEWAQRQARLAQEQQEKFRREQERIAAEKETKGGGPLTKTEILRLFAAHEQMWSSLETVSEVGWHSVPWPTLKRPSVPEEITISALSAYVLSPHGDKTKSNKERITQHIRRWHPDRFDTKLLPKVREHERAQVKQGAGEVARGLNELLTRTQSNDVFS